MFNKRGHCNEISNRALYLKVHLYNYLHIGLELGLMTATENSKKRRAEKCTPFESERSSRLNFVFSNKPFLFQVVLAFAVLHINLRYSRNMFFFSRAEHLVD